MHEIFAKNIFQRKIYVRSKFSCVRSAHDPCARAHAHSFVSIRNAIEFMLLSILWRFITGRFIMFDSSWEGSSPGLFFTGTVHNRTVYDRTLPIGHFHHKMIFNWNLKSNSSRQQIAAYSRLNDLESSSYSMSLSVVLPTTAIDTVSEFTRRSATGNCEWKTCQGLYVAAIARFEPTTLEVTIRSKGIDSTLHVSITFA